MAERWKAGDISSLVTEQGDGRRSEMEIKGTDSKGKDKRLNWHIKVSSASSGRQNQS